MINFYFRRMLSFKDATVTFVILWLLQMAHGTRHTTNQLRVTNGGIWGSWGPHEQCPHGTYAVGYEVKVISIYGVKRIIKNIKHMMSYIYVNISLIRTSSIFFFVSLKCMLFF